MESYPQITQISTDFVEEERDPETYRLIGAAMAVHRELGHGFLEQGYHEALKLELSQRGIPFASQVELPVHYKGSRLRCAYRADLVAFESVAVELKALDRLTELLVAQLINYLKASGLNRDLLLNFGGKSLEFKRIVY